MLTSEKDEEIDNPISINKTVEIEFEGERENEEGKGLNEYFKSRRSSKRKIHIPIRKLTDTSTEDELLSSNLGTSKPPPDTSIPRQAPKTILPGGVGTGQGTGGGGGGASGSGGDGTNEVLSPSLDSREFVFYFMYLISNLFKIKVEEQVMQEIIMAMVEFKIL